MAKLTLSASCYSTVTAGTTPSQRTGSIGIVIAVSNDDGTPVLNLTQSNFHVRMMQEGSLVAPSIAEAVDYFATFGNSGMRGVYFLAIAPASGPLAWGKAHYSVALRVENGADQGHVVVGTSVDPL